MRKKITTHVWDVFWSWEVLELPKKIEWKSWRYCKCKCLKCWNIYDNIRFENMYMWISKNCRSCWDNKNSKKYENERKEFIWKKYNKLTIIDVINKRNYKWWWKNLFKCKCDCWNTKDIPAWRVIKWEIKSCWCLLNISPNHTNKIEDLIWLKRWKLTLIWEYEWNDWRKWVKKYLFSCDCWSWRIVKSSLYDFKRWKILSCWCVKSQKQIDIFDYIKSLWYTTIENYNDWDRRLQIDVYLPEKKIWFEFNDMFFHSLKMKDRSYHNEKKTYYHNLWINIINIREDEWDNKKEIVKWFINSKLWIWSKLYARKLSIRNIWFNEYKLFCENNHLQWVSKNIPISIWMFDWDNLVSVSWFTNDWEMVRYCVKIWYIIVWWFEKIINFYIKEYKKNKIYTYANLDVVSIDNNVYERNWFKRWWLSFWSFFSDQKSYRIEKRKFKNMFSIDWKITEDILDSLKYVECVWAWIQKYVLELPTWN